MQEAESRSRKNRKSGPGVERLVNAARLGALSKELGVEIKRHRDPGNVTGRIDHGFDGVKEKPTKKEEKDETILLKSGF